MDMGGGERSVTAHYAAGLMGVLRLCKTCFLSQVRGASRYSRYLSLVRHGVDSRGRVGGSGLKIQDMGISQKGLPLWMHRVLMGIVLGVLSDQIGMDIVAVLGHSRIYDFGLMSQGVNKSFGSEALP